ncbi:MAG: AAA family ATPase [Candidatus Sabulitectum sp.]|nr:AAA family ATPase [Candidatus Sabulitectum sp.]
MVERFIATYQRLLRSTDYETRRYLYKDFNLNSRVTGLIGPRGTGKTTLLLQYIKNELDDVDKCIYASMDSVYFSHSSLVEFVDELYEVYGIRYFFLDEIHKYSNWNQELKNIYDSYPDVKVVFSGSSSIDLVKGAYDLSRRGVIYRLAGLSFREYLDFRGIIKYEAIEYEDLLKNSKSIQAELGSVDRIRGHFKDYLSFGYFPFFLDSVLPSATDDIQIESKIDTFVYSGKLFRIIEKTIYEDISNYYKIKTENLDYFKRILAYIATIPPGELSRNNIAKNIGLDNKTIRNYLNILQDTGLLALIASKKAGSNLLKQTEKIYLDNSNLYQAVINEIGYSSSVGSIREIFFVNMIRNSGRQLFYSHTGDFEVEGSVFEIGGRGKSWKQMREKLSNGYLVKDDILYGGNHEIPLYLFGFLY